MIDDQRAEEHPAALDPLGDRDQLGRWRTRRRAGRRRCRGHLDQAMESRALDGESVDDRDEVQHDGDQEPGRGHHGIAGRPDDQQAGDALEDRERIDEAVADEGRLPRAEVRVLWLLGCHRPHEREGEGRAECEDRSEHVQEEQIRDELWCHGLPPSAAVGMTAARRAAYGPVAGRDERLRDLLGPPADEVDQHVLAEALRAWRRRLGRGSSASSAPRSRPGRATARA